MMINIVPHTKTTKHSNHEMRYKIDNDYYTLLLKYWTVYGAKEIIFILFYFLILRKIVNYSNFLKCFEVELKSMICAHDFIANWIGNVCTILT